jgi:malate synthase
MADRIDRAGLQVAAALVRFLEEEALPGTGIEADAFWRGAADIYARFAPDNRALLATRDALQAKIDAWHEARPGQPDPAAYRAFLREIGYLADEPGPFTIDPANVDDEVARLAGPQLVVPVLNARFLLNAANARWGSLYDALYGTDALGGPPSGGSYDSGRGKRVTEWGWRFLDEVVPIEGDSWSNLVVPLFDSENHRLVLDCQSADRFLKHPEQFVGVRRSEGNGYPHSILLRHNGLHIELVRERGHPVAATNAGDVSDIILESALTTIVDLEDSIAAVDAEDKVAAYANWLGLMRGDLTARFDKGGRAVTRSLEEDRVYEAAGGSELSLPGRSLLFVRNVGHLMTTPAVLLPDGSEAPEGILDAIVTSLIALHDLKGLGRFRNSRAGSVYIVKPKMHGPDEAAFADALFNAVEDLLGLQRHTIKVGLMDEERRTSANLAACIHALRHRIVFINTGFLDRTGDEIHSSMRAGPMIPKAEMKGSAWIKAYEDRNVRIGLAAGFSGKAQIGKGMWAAPDLMGDMLAQKIAHSEAGASTAWVPSPTAATLHALHYHQVDVFERQRARAVEQVPPLDDLLRVPLATGRNWSAEEIRRELDNNAQGILGYVVRWIDQGVGCSKVPDIHDVGLMEDRATLRISSQHMANWLLHGICTADEVDAALRRMAAKVDAQNTGDPLYRPMSGNEETSLAFQAARALVFAGVSQPNGYTEPLLHSFRRRLKDGTA